MPTVSPLMRPAFPYADGFPSYAHLASSYANLAFSYANLAFPYAVCSLPLPPAPTPPPAPPAPSLRLTLSCPALPSPVPGTRESKLSGKPHVQGLLLQQAIGEIPFEWRSPIHYRVFLCSKLLGKSRLYSLLVQQAIGEVRFVGCLLQQAIGEVPFLVSSFAA